MIYLDYMATTPMDPAVVAELLTCTSIDTCFANPASTHWYGEQARERVRDARATVACALDCDPEGIVWTSGATESNNLALIGLSDYYGKQKKHIVTLATEHKAVLDPCIRLAKSDFQLTVLPVANNGLLDLQQLEAAISTDTLVVSVMAVNNEIGVIQPIKQIADIVHAKGALLHVDAVQALGKTPVSVREWDADLVSFSAHKIYGPKGIGVLYVRQKPKIRLQQRLFGGAQQSLRAGTLPVQQIVAMAKAMQMAAANQVQETARLAKLQQQLLTQLQQEGGILLNGDLQQRVAHNLNISVKGLNGDALRSSLYPHIAVSSGSACNAVTAKPSHVLMALGRDAQLADAALRISMGRFTTEADVATAGDILVEKIRWLRQIAGYSSR